MKILSKRHPNRPSTAVAQLPFTEFRWIPQVRHVQMPVHQEPWTHLEIHRGSALDYIDVPQLIETVQNNCTHYDSTKIMDFGDGEFTVEMWVKLPAGVREIDISDAIKNTCAVEPIVYIDGDQP